MSLDIVVAVDLEMAIGRNGKLPWHIPEDLKRFKDITMGRNVIMGRKTWESIPGNLPGRRCVVISSDPLAGGGVAVVASSFDDAVRKCDGNACVIGGSRVYSEALGKCDRVFLTQVLTRVQGADTWLKGWKHDPFEVTDREFLPTTDLHPAAFFITYRRKK